MVVEADVREALNTVMDPELQRSIVELGMVKDLQVSGKRVSFVLALTTLACPLREKIANDARAAIAGLDGDVDVAIELSEMTAAERTRLMESLQHGAAGQEEQPLAAHLNDIDKIIAVMSGKGGVGKSSVAAMLAVTLRKQGYRVGLLDADITGPSIPRMFDVSSRPGASPLGIIPAETSTGIKLVSINLLLPHDDDAVIWRGPLISGAIKQFWEDVFWGDLDYLILDLPPGTSDASLTVMQSIPLSGIVLVTSPQGLADMVVRKSAQMAIKLNVPILGLIENMSYAVCPKCGEQIEVFGPSVSAETAKVLGVPLLGRLPLDAELAVRCDSGRVESQPTEAFAPVVAQIVERVPETKCSPVFGHSH